MNKKNMSYLFKKYTKLFPSGVNVSPQESLMCFGIETNDGWFSLIDKLCKDIQDYVDKNNCEQPIVVQVKEKFSTLRYYTHNGCREIWDIINKAEEESSKICEQCGKKGRLRNINNWYHTLCKECFKKKKK